MKSVKVILDDGAGNRIEIEHNEQQSSNVIKKYLLAEAIIKAVKAFDGAYPNFSTLNYLKKELTKCDS